MLVTSVVVIVVVFLLGRSFAADYLEHKWNLQETLNEMNSELLKLNSVTAYLSWKLSTEPASTPSSKLVKLGKIQIEWRNNWCDRLDEIFNRIYKSRLHSESFYDDWDFQKDYKYEFRQFYLLCRGPNYNFEENR